MDEVGTEGESGHTSAWMSTLLWIVPSVVLWLSRPQTHRLVATTGCAARSLIVVARGRLYARLSAHERHPRQWRAVSLSGSPAGPLRVSVSSFVVCPSAALVVQSDTHSTGCRRRESQWPAQPAAEGRRPRHNDTGELEQQTPRRTTPATHPSTHHATSCAQRRGVRQMTETRTQWESSTRKHDHHSRRIDTST